MTIHLNLSAPEHSHLIVNYVELFPEHHAYVMDWDCVVMPRPGDVLDFEFIASLVRAQVDLAMLPKIWQVMDVRWTRSEGAIIPVLNVVGK